MAGADGFAVIRCVAVTGERMIFAVLRTSAPQGGERPMEIFNRDCDYKNGAIYIGTICKAPSLLRSLVYNR